MAGLVRPYTLQDVVAQLNSQSNSFQGSIVPLQGFFEQTNENISSVTDAFTTNVRASPNWDMSQWGFTTWG